MASVAPSILEKGTWDIQDVADFLGVSIKTIWRWQQAGRLPRGKKLPGRAVRWDPAVIRKWFDKLPATN